MFDFFKNKQNKQLKRKTKILSGEFVKKENSWNNVFDNPYVLTGSFIVIGVDEQKYVVKTTIDDMRTLMIKVYKENIELSNIKAYGNFSDKSNFFFERIENKNLQYKGFGWGTILMDCMMKTLNEYCKLNNYHLTRIFGTIGVGGGDTPERSMPLYLSYDNYSFDETRKLCLQKCGFNIYDKNLEYLIA